MTAGAAIVKTTVHVMEVALGYAMVTVEVVVPCAVGVPEITPADEMDTPAGRSEDENDSDAPVAGCRTVTLGDKSSEVSAEPALPLTLYDDGEMESTGGSMVLFCSLTGIMHQHSSSVFHWQRNRQTSPCWMSMSSCGSITLPSASWNTSVCTLSNFTSSTHSWVRLSMAVMGFAPEVRVVFV